MMNEQLKKLAMDAMAKDKQVGRMNRPMPMPMDSNPNSSPMIEGVELGQQSESMKAPGKPEIVKEKKYVKPFVSKPAEPTASKPRPMGAPVSRNALGRAIGAY